VFLVQQNWQVASANAILARSGKSLMTNAAYAQVSTHIPIQNGCGSL
jgi:hypothetical protein